MSNNRTRMAPDARSAEILDAAVKLAKRIGFRKLTRDGVAKAASVSTGLVSTHFDGIEKLRDEVMRVAIRDEILPIVADGIANGNRLARRAPVALRQRAVQSLAS
jgi:AcrR family transcriptional regulator